MEADSGRSSGGGRCSLRGSRYGSQPGFFLCHPRAGREEHNCPWAAAGAAGGSLERRLASSPYGSGYWPEPHSLLRSGGSHGPAAHRGGGRHWRGASCALRGRRDETAGGARRPGTGNTGKSPSAAGFCGQRRSGPDFDPHLAGGLCSNGGCVHQQSLRALL